MVTDDSSEQRSERKRRDILASARKRFMVEGYASTGMEQVARDAQVSTATLYSYFSSKADLFQHVVEDAAESFSQLITETSEVDGDPTAQLRNFAYAYARFMGDPFVRSVFRLVAAERRRFETVARHFFDRGRRDFGGTLIAILERLKSEGKIDAEKLSWAAGQLMGMIEHPTFVVPMITGDEHKAQRSLQHICDEAVSTFLARYGVRDASWEQAGAVPRVAQALAAEQ